MSTIRETQQAFFQILWRSSGGNLGKSVKTWTTNSQHWNHRRKLVLEQLWSGDKGWRILTGQLPTIDSLGTSLGWALNGAFSKRTLSLRKEQVFIVKLLSILRGLRSCSIISEGEGRSCWRRPGSWWFLVAILRVRDKEVVPSRPLEFIERAQFGGTSSWRESGRWRWSLLRFGAKVEDCGICREWGDFGKTYHANLH